MQTGKNWDRLVVGSLTICKIYMEFGGCQDDVAPKAALSVLRGRAFANLTEPCTRAVKLCTDNVPADDWPVLRRGQEIVEGMQRDMLAWWRWVLALPTHTTMRRGISTRPLGLRIQKIKD